MVEQIAIRETWSQSRAKINDLVDFVDQSLAGIDGPVNEAIDDAVFSIVGAAPEDANTLEKLADTLAGFTSLSIGSLKAVLLGSTAEERGEVQRALEIPHIDLALHGCVGDGVTDDNAKFQTALALAKTLGVAVYVNEGLRLRGVKIREYDPSKVRVHGPGTVLQESGPDSSICIVERPTPPSIPVSAVAKITLGAMADPANPNLFNDRLATLWALTAPTVGIETGQVYLLSSRDAYPWSSAAAALDIGDGTKRIYQAEYVHIAGIGLQVGSVGSAAKGQVVVGQISGATAEVASVAERSGANYLIFNSISGQFQSGESLTINGSAGATTVSAAPVVLIADQLYDTYSTSVILQRLDTDSVFEWDGPKIEALGDINATIGKDNRQIAIDLRGVYRPKINTKINGGWQTAIRLSSCYVPEFDVTATNLANDAREGETPEGGYGYVVEFFGACYGGGGKINASWVRHAVTTNPAYHSAYSGTEQWRRGCAQYAKVKVIATACYGQAVDQHYGSRFMWFDGFDVGPNVSTLREITSPFGIVNRGFGTLYSNGRVRRPVVGFMDLAQALPLNYKADVVVRNVDIIDYQYAAFAQAQASALGATRYNQTLRLERCRGRGDGSASNSPYLQRFFSGSSSGANLTVKGIVSERCNNRHFDFSTMGAVQIDDVDLDFTDGLGGDCFVFRNTVVTARSNVSNVRVRPFSDGGSANPTSFIRIESNTNVTIPVSGEFVQVGTRGTAIPLLDARGDGVHALVKRPNALDALT